MVNEINVAKHYDKSDLYEVIKKGLLESGLILDSLSSQDLSMVDEFHIGGTSGTKFVTEKLGSTETSKILDIGCGGGLLSEPITRLGAEVTGIDASKKNIEVAKFAAKLLKIKLCNTVVICIWQVTKQIMV